MTDKIIENIRKVSSDYFNENQFENIRKSILSGKTPQLVSIQGGIKYKKPILSILMSDYHYTGVDGWSTKESKKLNRIITVDDIKIDEFICNHIIKSGNLLISDKIEQIQLLIEDLVWKGDKDLTGNLALTNGFIKLLDTGYYNTYTNIDEKTIDEMISKVPEEIKDKRLVLFIGQEDCNNLSEKLKSKLNKFDIEPIGFEALNYENIMCISDPSNFVIGTDLLHDYEEFSLNYDYNLEGFKFLCKFKLGVQIYKLENVVYYKK